MQLDFNDLERKPWWDPTFKSNLEFFRNKDGLATYQRGKGETILFVHGTPSWTYEYRALFEMFSQHYHCVGIDHLGFGLSLRPEDADYSIRAHQQRFLKAIEAMSLKSFHLVVHDVGGVIALPMLSSHSQAIKSVNVLNSWLWPFEQVDASFAKQKKWFAGKLMRWLYLSANFSPKFMVKQSWGSHQPLTSKEHRSFIEMFPTRESRLSAYGILRSFIDEQALYENALSQSQWLKDHPLTLIWGMGDRFINTKHLLHWKQSFPHGKVHELKNVGHFPQLENPSAVALHLRQSLSQSGAR